MVFVITQEGKYPSGAAAEAWPFYDYHELRRNRTVQKFMIQGEEWKECTRCFRDRWNLNRD